MSKVIFKMTFKHPNLKDTVSKNVSHVKYIATRPGTDKTITEGDLKKELSKGIEELSSEDELYLKYIDERPRSHGLFGEDGIEDPKEVQEELSQVNSFVWRGIISLREEDAINLGYLEKEKWQDMLRKIMPDIVMEMGLSPINVRWVGAIHMEKGHPHAHVMIWEKEVKKSIGVISENKLNNMRKLFTDEIFTEERFQIMNEKNIMRDLIRDLAKNDISKATQIIKEVRAAGQELNAFGEVIEEEGITPKLFNQEEKKIAEMVKDLSDKLPGKGRVALKFMPEDIKEEVRNIADYLLRQPAFLASLEKNLNAVEELTKMYTGKDEAIQKARDNAYKNIRDRVCQVVLKGAAESQRDNIFYVDQELSQKAVDFIKNMNNQIELVPEQSLVLNKITLALTRTGYNSEDVFKILKDFTVKEGIDYPEEELENIINNIFDNKEEDQDINPLSSLKKVNYYLSIIKLSGATEQEAFSYIKNIIKEDSQKLENQLRKLKDGGFLKKVDEEYKLTNKGIEEFLKVKELDRAEREILKMLENDGEKTKNITFNEILDNKNVFANLIDKDPEELKIGKFDTKIRELFGEKNKITFTELENNIYEKYTDDELNTNIEKAEQEIDILKNRIQKLTLNGFVEFNKDTGAYSFTPEAINYFQYDDKKENYILSEEAIKNFNIPEEMEFTRYDANITLNYIDKAEGGILTANNLKEILNQEIVNKTAQIYYEKFKELIDTDLIEKTKEYISIDEKGNLSSTDEGKWLGVNLNKVNKYFKEAKGQLTDEKLKELCSTEQEYQNVLKQLEKQVEKGHVEKNQETGIYKVNPIIKNISNLLYQIYKEGGSINKENLKEVLEKNIPNYEAEKQFKYLTWRLDNLKEQGYLKGQKNEYLITQSGIEKRADILIPERNLLRGTLEYLERLGLITYTDEGYQATDKYYKYMKNIAISKETKTARISEFISKNICELIDRTQDKVNVGKIERVNEKIATGKYINNEYAEIKTNYEDIRATCGVSDIVEKTINKISTTLLVSGVSIEETKEIINNWASNFTYNIESEKLNKTIDKAYKNVSENNLWGKTTVISSKEWKLMFEAIGIQENDMPKWIYKGENWQSFNSNFTTINDIWKSIWRALEGERMTTEAQVEQMKKQLEKQQANISKEAQKEQARKNKDKGTLYKDEELER